MTILEQREKDLEQTIKLYNSLKSDINSGTSFEEYSKIYSFTNEGLANLFLQMNFSCKNKALSVLSSGDHAFNLICMGIEKVDTFDTNRLTEYYALGLKKTAIQCLKFEEFLELFSKIKTKKQIEMLEFVIQNMDKVYQNYFQELLNCFKGNAFENVSFLFRRDIDLCDRQINNLYLGSKINYQKLQGKLNSAEINFKCCNVFDIPKEFGQYDLVELSNILGSIMRYQNIFKRKRVSPIIHSIYKNNLTESGELLFDYCWGVDKESRDSCEKIFNKIDYAEKTIYFSNNDAIRSLKK